ncbi:hypothetical protein PIIN_10855 [Serendipita indica DSM 11827]|uniref:Uncharacterized protein n=1 Tax=Serendipita indica (strain DSM 11827) TaxID=1109443 RepID=G4TZX7_SERID|nr:hypothetical protein PIIN_10855 [Serendipita indica DSM 11827]
MSANDLIRSQPLSDPKFDLPVEFLEQQLRDTLISSEQESTSTFISTPEQRSGSPSFATPSTP